MADHEKKSSEDCFGCLEKVFPMGPDGLRCSPPECFACSSKTECLRAALDAEEGIAVHAERLQRAYEGGSEGFLGRWAKQKTLNRRKSQMKSTSGLGKALAIIALAIFLLTGLIFLGLLNNGLWDRFTDYYDLVSDREWMRATVQSAGWAAALVLVGLQIGQVLFAPIPGELTGFLGGYMFGAWHGFLLSTIGLTLGSMINFGIGHFLGERVVRRLVRCETYEKYNEMVQYKGILFIFIFFLIPGFPKDYLCMFLGLTALPARVFFTISTIGRIPGTLALSLQGASIFERDYVFFIIVTLLCLLFALAAYLTRDPLYRWMARLSKKRSCAPAP
jgi:uncharacterized membrane protein YdjX (TVP38/TMEM64 family)